MRRFACLSLLPIVVMACSKEPASGGLTLSMRTDLVVPTGVDVVGVYIVRVNGAAITPLLTSEVTAVYTDASSNQKRAALPGTLAIISDGDPTSTVQVRIVAYDANRTPIAMREARVRVPTSANKLLPMPLLWLNTEDVNDASPGAGGPTPISRASAGLGFLGSAAPGEVGVKAFARFQSDFCGAERTLDDTGACAAIDIDPDSLEDVEAAYEFGAADRANEPVQGPPGTPGPHNFCGSGLAPDCFNLAGCFDPRTLDDPDPNFRTLRAQIEGLDTPQCFVSLADVPRGIAALNAAVVVEATKEQGAVCTDSGKCYIALDQRSGASFDSGTRRLLLPPGVCRKANKGSVLAVLASPLCKRKAADQSVCTNEAGVAIEEGCRNGSGWNGEGDPSEPDDTSTDGSTKTCAAVQGATGFWVGPDLAHVVDSNGTLYTFPTSAFGSCLNGPRPLGFASGVRAGAPYRLLGSSVLPRAVVLMGGIAAPTDSTTALVTFDADGGPRTLVSPPGFVSAGGFFSDVTSQTRSGPGAVSFPAAGSLLAVSRPDLTESESVGNVSPFAVGSNVVSTDSNGAPLATLAIQSDTGLQLVECYPATMLGGYSSCTAATPEDATLSDLTPNSMASAGSGNRYLLASRAAQVTLLQTRKNGATDPFTVLHTLAPGQDLYPETTLAVAEDANGRPRAYFGTQGAVVVIEYDGSVAHDRIAIALEPRHIARAVQIYGSHLYWLDVDGSGAGTVHRKAIDDTGVLTD